MINIETFISDAIKILKKMNNLNCLDIKNYKKDRGVLIEKVDDKYNLYENGFYKQEFKNVKEEELKKILKIIKRREFPKSNMLRFYKLENKLQNK